MPEARRLQHRAVRGGTVSPAAGGNILGSSHGTVREKVPVCSPRDGNGTGTWVVIRTTRRDGSTRFVGGAGRDGIGERVGNAVGKTAGGIVGHAWLGSD